MVESPNSARIVPLQQLAAQTGPRENLLLPIRQHHARLNLDATEFILPRRPPSTTEDVVPS